MAFGAWSCSVELRTDGIRPEYVPSNLEQPSTAASWLRRTPNGRPERHLQRVYESTSTYQRQRINDQSRDAGELGG